jgi:hypothetical protein
MENSCLNCHFKTQKRDYIDFETSIPFCTDRCCVKFMTKKSDSMSMIKSQYNKCTFAHTMRKLMEDHIIWTRLYIISVAHDLDDKTFNLTRLLKNQEDIGNAFGQFYGENVKVLVTKLFTEHIEIAGQIIDAVKNNKSSDLFIKQWEQNAKEIAKALSKLNPLNWKQKTVQDAMNKHLQDTLLEATHRLNKEYEHDIKDYDNIHDHILIMADLFSSGIIKQFPEKFK